MPGLWAGGPEPTQAPCSQVVPGRTSVCSGGSPSSGSWSCEWPPGVLRATGSRSRPCCLGCPTQGLSHSLGIQGGLDGHHSGLGVDQCAFCVGPLQWGVHMRRGLCRPWSSHNLGVDWKSHCPWASTQRLPHLQGPHRRLWRSGRELLQTPFHPAPDSPCTQAGHGIQLWAYSLLLKL